VTAVRDASLLRLGIVGMSDGNGHPFSWSAIVNGYDKELIKSCGFPVIARYLDNHKIPEPCFKNVAVTHVVTQDPNLSQRIARTCKIANVSLNIEEMLPDVDAVILARDDAETHFDLSLPVLRSGKRILIDKPLAYSSREADRILENQLYDGQVFSASGLSFEPKLLHMKKKLANRLAISIDAYISGPWPRYAIHVIEPVVRAAGIVTSPCLLSVIQSGEIKAVTFGSEQGLLFRVTCFPKSYGVPPVISSLMDDGKVVTITLSDTYRAFRNMLSEFVRECVTGEPAVIDSMRISVSMVEKGINQ
jgi:hypothetical protein